MSAGTFVAAALFSTVTTKLPSAFLRGLTAHAAASGLGGQGFAQRQLPGCAPTQKWSVSRSLAARFVLIRLGGFHTIIRKKVLYL